MNIRITSGALKNTILKAPSGHRTHPMSEKLRSALFNTLGDIAGLTVLDAFAGTGAIALEAISRGASSAILLENDSRAQAVIRENIHYLHLETVVKLTKAPVYTWSEKNPEQLFDIVIADPPFDEIQDSALSRLSSHLTENGVLVINLPSSYKVPEFEKLSQVKTKLHGKAQLVFYKN